jgi:hypothetical protein
MFFYWANHIAFTFFSGLLQAVKGKLLLIPLEAGCIWAVGSKLIQICDYLGVHPNQKVCSTGNHITGALDDVY